MSEKANDLLNKFCGAQFDFMIWNTPDNLVARDKARQEISDYIAELELGLNNQTVHSNTLQKILTEKLARIAELEEKQRWIPVDEKPLEVGVYFVRLKNGLTKIDWTFIDDGIYYWWNSDQDSVTHYMPLPQPPEVKE